MRAGPAPPAALITGATGGVGTAVTLERARSGWRLGLVARDRSALDAVARAANEAGAAEARSASIDLGAPESAQALSDLAEQLCPIDLLVHAAGSPRRGSLDEISDADWASAFSVKFLGAVRLVKAASPFLAPGASIVLVAGGAAQQPDPQYAVGAINAALEHLTKTLALDLAGRNVRVNAISPGPTRTPRLESRCHREAERRATTPDVVAAEIAATLPLQRLTEPEEIAAAVAYLVSAPSMSGDVLRISSGAAARAL